MYPAAMLSEAAYHREAGSNSTRTVEPIGSGLAVRSSIIGIFKPKNPSAEQDEKPLLP
jgi:hypothetical protein